MNGYGLGGKENVYSTTVNSQFSPGGPLAAVYPSHATRGASSYHRNGGVKCTPQEESLKATATRFANVTPAVATYPRKSPGAPLKPRARAALEVSATLNTPVRHGMFNGLNRNLYPDSAGPPSQDPWGLASPPQSFVANSPRQRHCALRSVDRQHSAPRRLPNLLDSPLVPRSVSRGRAAGGNRPKLLQQPPHYHHHPSPSLKLFESPGVRTPGPQLPRAAGPIHPSYQQQQQQQSVSLLRGRRAAVPGGGDGTHNNVMPAWPPQGTHLPSLPLSQPPQLPTSTGGPSYRPASSRWQLDSPVPMLMSPKHRQIPPAVRNWRPPRSAMPLPPPSVAVLPAANDHSSPQQPQLEEGQRGECKVNDLHHHPPLQQEDSGCGSAIVPPPSPPHDENGNNDKHHASSSSPYFTLSSRVMNDEFLLATESPPAAAAADRGAHSIDALASGLCAAAAAEAAASPHRLAVASSEEVFTGTMDRHQQQQADDEADTSVDSDSSVDGSAERCSSTSSDTRLVVVRTSSSDALSPVPGSTGPSGHGDAALTFRQAPSSQGLRRRLLRWLESRTVESNESSGSSGRWHNCSADEGDDETFCRAFGAAWDNQLSLAVEQIRAALNEGVKDRVAAVVDAQMRSRLSEETLRARRFVRAVRGGLACVTRRLDALRVAQAERLALLVEDAGRLETQQKAWLSRKQNEQNELRFLMEDLDSRMQELATREAEAQRERERVTKQSEAELERLKQQLERQNAEERQAIEMARQEQQQAVQAEAATLQKEREKLQQRQEALERAEAKLRTAEAHHRQAEAELNAARAKHEEFAVQLHKERANLEDAGKALQLRREAAEVEFQDRKKVLQEKEKLLAAQTEKLAYESADIDRRRKAAQLRAADLERLEMRWKAAGDTLQQKEKQLQAVQSKLDSTQLQLSQTAILFEQKKRELENLTSTADIQRGRALSAETDLQRVNEALQKAKEEFNRETVKHQEALQKAKEEFNRETVKHQEALQKAKEELCVRAREECKAGTAKRRGECPPAGWLTRDAQAAAAAAVPLSSPILVQQQRHKEKNARSFAYDGPHDQMSDKENCPPLDASRKLFDSDESTPTTSVGHVREMAGKFDKPDLERFVRDVQKLCKRPEQPVTHKETAELFKCLQRQLAAATGVDHSQQQQSAECCGSRRRSRACSRACSSGSRIPSSVANKRDRAATAGTVVTTAAQPGFQKDTEASLLRKSASLSRGSGSSCPKRNSVS